MVMIIILYNKKTEENKSRIAVTFLYNNKANEHKERLGKQSTSTDLTEHSICQNFWPAR